MKRIFSLFLACLISLAFLPSASYAQQSAQSVFGQEELDQLLAPIALYPDSLLTQVLMAATYPLETVQAARFVKQNPSLGGEALARAIDEQSWDPSVKALIQFPTVLAMMDEQLVWTQKLGDAFLAQQDAVMDTVQSLRARAQAAGSLQSNQQQQVVRQDSNIIIEPYTPDVYYVPYYDPTVVYGGWWWPNRPPMVWAPPMYRSPSFGHVFATGIVFGIGVGIIDSIFIDSWPDWHRHYIVVNNAPAYHRPDRGFVWTHDPDHRRGIAYRDNETRDRYQTWSNNDNHHDSYRDHHEGNPQRQSSQPAIAPSHHDGQNRLDDQKPRMSSHLNTQQVPDEQTRTDRYTGQHTRVESAPINPTLPSRSTPRSVPEERAPVITSPEPPRTERPRSESAPSPMMQPRPAQVQMPAPAQVQAPTPAPLEQFQSANQRRGAPNQPEAHAKPADDSGKKSGRHSESETDKRQER